MVMLIRQYHKGIINLELVFWYEATGTRYTNIYRNYLIPDEIIEFILNIFQSY